MIIRDIKESCSRTLKSENLNLKFIALFVDVLFVWLWLCYENIKFVFFFFYYTYLSQ